MGRENAVLTVKDGNNMERPTPYFEINESKLQRDFDKLTTSLKENWSNYRIGYSFKTNSLPWLVRFYQKQGVSAEVVSQDEYSLARYMEFRDDEIIYNGPYKSRQSFRDVVLAGGIVNMDSQFELDWLTELSKEYPEKTLNVGIRVNFNLESMCPGETTMGEESGRFGYSYEDGTFAKILEQVRAIPNVRVNGIHLHSSSKSRSVAIFKSIADMACRLKREFQLRLDYVDIGGGYCGGMKGRPEFPDYFPVVAEVLSEEFKPEETTLVVEPGISLLSSATTFTTSIIDVRDIRGSRYLISDGSRFNIDATMIKNSYLYHTELQPGKERKIIENQTITGYTCMECDRLFEMKDLPELFVGDRIVYENVGGYTLSLNPLFIQYFPDVYVNKGEETIKVREKWTPKEYVQNCVWEQK